jgi:hypothetical protein
MGKKMPGNKQSLAALDITIQTGHSDTMVSCHVGHTGWTDNVFALFLTGCA